MEKIPSNSNFTFDEIICQLLEIINFYIFYVYEYEYSFFIIISLIIN
jgi:hypothetical protein